MGAPTYANVVELAAAGDIPITLLSEQGMLRHLDASSRQMERLCDGRRFYPTLATRTFDFPNLQGRGTSERLWLDDDELIELTSLTVAGTLWGSGTYRLQPQSGPPYRWIEPTDLATAQPFRSGSNGSQGSISIVGKFGHSETLVNRGTLAAAVASTSTTTVTLSDGSLIGAGQALLIGDEYLTVESMGWVDTGDNLAAALTVDHTDQALTVADGTLYTPGETLRVGTERLLVVDVIGNTVYVERSADGSYMAGHALGVDIYARRLATVARGQLGSTADTHADGATVQALQAPGVVRNATIGKAMMTIAQEAASWARMVGSGESEREARGASLRGYLDELQRDYGQRGRVNATGGLR